MTKSEMVANFAERTGFTKAQASEAMSAFLDMVKDELVAKKKVSLPGFGVFNPTVRKERECHNPQTGVALTVPARNAVNFKPSKVLKDSMNA